MLTGGFGVDPRIIHALVVITIHCHCHVRDAPVSIVLPLCSLH